MSWLYERPEESLLCEMRVVPRGIALVWLQEGEEHVEHFADATGAEERRREIERNLLHAGWTFVSEQPGPMPD